LLKLLKTKKVPTLKPLMIICAGESLIDMVSFRGEPEYTPHVGGSNFNSSIALGRLGSAIIPFNSVYGLSQNTLLKHN
tara:strand:+ start:790 stop:1023 length:234 start_codon:yes stop_codon:yes gene_type:complete